MQAIKTTQEQDLIRRLKEGSQSAFKELLDAHQERLYWHIRNMVKSHDDTDDVLQNVCIKIFRSIKNFKGDSQLYTWMYRIATNESITFLNKQAKLRNRTVQEYQEDIIGKLESDVYFDGDEIQLKLQKAIATLPPKQQQIFQMKYFQDITYDAMSEILTTSTGGLKSSYHIAVKKVTEYLKTH